MSYCFFIIILNEKIIRTKNVKRCFIYHKRNFSKNFNKKKNQNEPKKIYDVYRSFQKVIIDVNFVANNYLALDFTEEHLQNSSFGEPVDK